MPRRSKLAALGLAALVGASLAGPATLATGPAGPAGAAAPGSTLSWSKCRGEDMGSFQCATLVVPMDYSRPTGPKVKVAVARAKATGTRRGTLVFDPGGPGEPGVPHLPGLAKVVSPEVRRHFDLVAFDPRGTGASQPVLECGQPQQDGAGSQLNLENAVAYYTQQVQTQSGALSACVKRQAPFINSVGTLNVARDLDQLRRALGDQQINYWGVSYGTRIGAVYAQLFPTHLRTEILDGNVPPNTDLLGFLTGAVTGRDQAYAFFAQHYPRAGAAFTALVQRLQSGPVKLQNGKGLSLGDVAEVVTGALSSEVSYPKLAEQLTELAQAVGVKPTTGPGSTGELPLPPNDGPQEIQTAEGGGTNGTALRAVNCIDIPGRPTPQQMAQAATQLAPTAPLFGDIDLSLLPLCAGFPVQEQPIPTIHPQGAPGALVVNSQFDPATPLTWAQQMAQAIPGSRMVVYQGSQHGVTWMMGSSCVNAVANHYVLTGQLPSANVTCPVVKPPSQ